MSRALTVAPVGYDSAAEFVAMHHYAKSMPSITKHCFGLFDGKRLMGVATWGYGTRPLHTLKAIFPTLDVPQYLELGRLCVSDELPRNTESQFIAGVTAMIREHVPAVKLLFSWADGMRGKPGYVYQACSWLYGGFIWTDAYLTDRGEIVHPRLYQTKVQDGRDQGMICGQRPTPEQLTAMGWRHYFGKQFRYCRFLCSRGEQKAALKTSPFRWTNLYPKHSDLEWKVNAGKGSRVSCEQPMFAGAVQFRSPAPLFDQFGGEGEVDAR